MATVPLIVGGVFTLAGTDFSDAVTKVTLLGTADEVSIPATLAGPKSSRKGGVKYEIQIDYLSNDLASELFTALWAALSSGTGELAFTVKMRDGAISSTNPEWGGTLIVLGSALGGEAEGLSTDSQTFPLTGAPVKDTTP